MAAIRAKKRLGQNFLISKNIINKVINSISPSPSDTIVEIGPGKGALTQSLADSGARIIAVEFDKELAAFLKNKFSDYKNVTLLQLDFLKFEPERHGITSFKLCGNLPFNISSPVIEWAVTNHPAIIDAVLMLQKEVALRLSSKPGGKQWSPLAIFTQLYFEIDYLFSVQPEHFKPKPEVTSAVVALMPKDFTDLTNFEEFERIVRASFKQRRKQLINNLVPEIVPMTDTAISIFKELGLNRNVRAEEISTQMFLELTAKLKELSLI